MKTNEDPRHQRRIRLFQLLYGTQFSEQVRNSLPSDIEQTIERIESNKEKIHSIVDVYATKFSSSRMSKIDLAILTLAVFEMLFEKKEPYKVIADEAIEIAKEFGSSHSPQFVSGIVGKIISDAKNEQLKTA